MKRYRVTLENDFHNTEIEMMAEDKNGRLYLSEGQRRKAKRTLCGIDGCTCSDSAGARPSQGVRLHDFQGRGTGYEFDY